MLEKTKERRNKGRGNYHLFSCAQVFCSAYHHINAPNDAHTAPMFILKQNTTLFVTLTI